MRYRQVSARSVPVLFLSFLSLLQPAQMVKHENFKTCSQSGFCKRNRALAGRAHAAGASWTAPYELDEGTLRLKDGVLTGKIWKTEAGAIELPLQVSLFENGVARVTIDEARRRTEEITLRHDSKARKERYNEAEKWALVGDHKYQRTAAMETKEGVTTIVYGPDSYEARITHKPFSIQFLKGGEVYVVFNDRKLINVEHWRPKIEKAEGEELTEDEETYWEETFGGNTDSKPRGNTYALSSLIVFFPNNFKALNPLLWTLLSLDMITCMVFLNMLLAFRSRKPGEEKAITMNRIAYITPMSLNTRPTPQ